MSNIKITKEEEIIINILKRNLGSNNIKLKQERFDNLVDYIMLNETNPQLHAADPKDFKKIYDATMQLLFKISYRVVNDEEAAEDLVHDSLIKMNEKELVFYNENMN